MAKELSIENWQDNIQGGIDYLKEYGTPTAWEIYRSYYRNDFSKGNINKPKYSVALIYSILRSMIPKIYFTDPKVHVLNQKPGFYIQSKIVQKIDNKLIRRTKVKKIIKKAIQEASICGTAPILSGFDSEFGYSPDWRKKIEDEETGLQRFIGGTVTMFDEKTGYRLEYNQNIKPGTPWVLNVKPDFFIVPYGYSDFDTVPWVARLYIRPLEDVKNDSKLKNTANVKANGMSTYNFSQEARLHQKLPDKNYGDYCFLWEIRDLKRNMLYIMQDGYDKWLYNDIDYLGKFGNPYFELTFNPDPTNFWGISDAKMLEDQQLAINETRTLHIEHRRIAKLRFLYDENVITDEEVQKIMTEDTGAAVKCNGAVRDAVYPLQPYVPPDFNIDVDAIRQDAREISGLSRNQVGEYEGGRQTATEAQIVNVAAQIRVNERRDQVADLLTDIVQKYNKYIFSEWNVEQVEDIIGDDGNRYWVKFQNKEIESDYTFTVDPENSMPTSTQQRRQDAIMLAQYLQSSPVVQQAVQTGQPIPYNFAELDRYVASQFEHLPVDQIIPPRAGWGNNPEQPLPISEVEKQIGQNIQAQQAQGGVPVEGGA